LTCIAAAPASSIKSVIEHQASFFTPTVDNRTYLADSARARRSGTTARIPILSGSNANEGRILVVGQENVTAYLEYTLGDKYTENPELVERIRAAYPVGGNEFPTGYDAIAAMETHVSFQCGEALVANDTAELGVSSWRYFVSFVPTHAHVSRDRLGVM
jgi:carboxylesterase type B